MRILGSDTSIFNTEVGAKTWRCISGDDTQQCQKNDRMVQHVCLFCSLIILTLLTLQTETLLNLYQELMAEV